jgi:16S rRNA (guanine(966)-N(2))-methyltransferase RsmD
MKIIAGNYKGRRIFCSKDYSIRPTANRIKESIFNTLQDFCRDKVVLDLFSGSGNLGLESLSRGARKVVFVELSLKSIGILKKNIEHLKIAKNVTMIIKKDAAQFCHETQDQFDLILIDPPFHYPPLQELISLIFQRKILKNEGVLVVEHEISNPINSLDLGYSILKQRIFGRSVITFIMNGN